MKTFTILCRTIKHEVKLDDADFDRITARRWQIHYSKSGKPYVRRSVYPRSKPASILIHREVFGEIPVGLCIDHINGDPLDNRRCNLRLATQSQNCANRSKYRGTSGFKGVSQANHRTKWVATIFVNGKRIHLGCFDNPQDAAHVYDVAAIRHFGEFAYTNETANRLGGDK